MTRLVNTNPELFKNETLGEASPTNFLDEVTLQNSEDKAARIEKREPKTYRRDVRYPTFKPSGSVPSTIQDEVSVTEPGSESGVPVADNGLKETDPVDLSDL